MEQATLIDRNPAETTADSDKSTAPEVEIPTVNLACEVGSSACNACMQSSNCPILALKKESDRCSVELEEPPRTVIEQLADEKVQVVVPEIRYIKDTTSTPQPQPQPQPRQVVLYGQLLSQPARYARQSEPRHMSSKPHTKVTDRAPENPPAPVQTIVEVAAQSQPSTQVQQHFLNEPAITTPNLSGLEAQHSVVTADDKARVVTQRSMLVSRNDRVVEIVEQFSSDDNPQRIVSNTYAAKTTNNTQRQKIKRDTAVWGLDSPSVSTEVPQLMEVEPLPYQESMANPSIQPPEMATSLPSEQAGWTNAAQAERCVVEELALSDDIGTTFDVANSCRDGEPGHNVHLGSDRGCFVADGGEIAPKMQITTESVRPQPPEIESSSSKDAVVCRVTPLLYDEEKDFVIANDDEDEPHGASDQACAVAAIFSTMPNDHGSDEGYQISPLMRGTQAEETVQCGGDCSLYANTSFDRYAPWMHRVSQGMTLCAMTVLYIGRMACDSLLKMEIL